MHALKRRLLWPVIGLAAIAAAAHAAPSVYPTGVTIYDPAQAWNGYTVLSLLGTRAVVVIDMNGREVKRWEDYNDSAGGPARILPGGNVIAAAGARPPHQEATELVQRDFAGNVVWRFDRNQRIETDDGQTIWSARQHHDWQRGDFPAGYYSPAFTPAATGAATLLLTHTSHKVPRVTDVPLEDDRLIEVSPDGEILWEWTAGEHIDELGFADDAREVIRAARGMSPRLGAFDWLHINSATYVGPNRWFDAGDARFAPENVVVSSRQASIIAIIERSGKVAWRIGPDFRASEALRAIGQIIGPHHPHIIPKGLPGAGNLLVFDNGGSSGYGFAGPMAPDGVGAFARAYSRVLEIDPVSLELVWSYVARNQFFSTNISGAQRLPNGNTLITEGAPGRVFEVTSDGRIVWEYLVPYFSQGERPSNAVYRAYRVPYEWIPQLAPQPEEAVTPPALGEFRVP
ncbi:MAG TPA: aryl-sulfate sulfotransferase [Gammaproteobacteria bacterium]